jgi:hypothetical protein
MERRYSQRKPAAVHVYVSFAGRETRRYKTMNLSSHGLSINTGKRQARPGAIASLTFVINQGNLVRLHRRKATVAHVTSTSTGMMLHNRNRARNKVAS